MYCSILNAAESLKTSRSTREKFSLKSFITLKPTWPPKPPVKSPESQESMISPSHSSPSLPPSPELPSKIRQLQAATAKTICIPKLPVIKKPVDIKITFEEACCEPMDIESYYAVENVSFVVAVTYVHTSYIHIYICPYTLTYYICT